MLTLITLPTLKAKNNEFLKCLLFTVLIDGVLIAATILG